MEEKTIKELETELYFKKMENKFGEHYTNNTVCKSCNTRVGEHYGLDCPDKIENFDEHLESWK